MLFRVTSPRSRSCQCWGERSFLAGDRCETRKLKIENERVDAAQRRAVRGGKHVGMIAVKICFQSHRIMLELGTVQKQVVRDFANLGILV